uniref:Transmembrane protein n=1 Tax=Cacopsylla melanoneura TaxID=428564 RepID=A0A8D9ASY7_9HEMI
MVLAKIDNQSVRVNRFVVRLLSNTVSGSNNIHGGDERASTNVAQINPLRLVQGCMPGPLSPGSFLSICNQGLSLVGNNCTTGNVLVVVVVIVVGLAGRFFILIWFLLGMLGVERLSLIGVSICV